MERKAVLTVKKSQPVAIIIIIIIIIINRFV